MSEVRFLLPLPNILLFKIDRQANADVCLADQAFETNFRQAHGAQKSVNRLEPGDPVIKIWKLYAAECDAGNIAGTTSEEKSHIKSLEREVRELRQANEILQKASAYFAQAELDRPFRKW